MSPSPLARRLQEFEADLETLRQNDAPAPRRMVVRELQEIPRKPLRRPRAGGIRTGDQGLRSFRVR